LNDTARGGMSGWLRERMVGERKEEVRDCRSFIMSSEGWTAAVRGEGRSRKCVQRRWMVFSGIS
jgi:hypothetical protein